MRHLFILLAVLMSPTLFAQYQLPLQKLEEIDRAIANSSEYVTKRETRISEARKTFAEVKDTSAKYETALQLYDLYRPFVSDSAIFFLREAIRLADIMGDRDDYLDVFVEDMKYSDQPITRYISEGLADIYQDIKDFIFVFRQGVNRNMHNALATCQDNFKLYWGQKLVNALRALHEVKFDTHREDDN